MDKMDIIKALLCETAGPDTAGVATSKQTPFEIGKPYFVRTVTFHCTGMLKEIKGDFLIFEKAAYIGDSKRFFGFLTKWKDNNPEIEPFVSDLYVHMGAIVDATPWTQDLPETQQ